MTNVSSYAMKKEGLQRGGDGSIVWQDIETAKRTVNKRTFCISGGRIYLYNVFRLNSMRNYIIF